MKLGYWHFTNEKRSSETVGYWSRIHEHGVSGGGVEATQLLSRGGGAEKLCRDSTGGPVPRVYHLNVMMQLALQIGVGRNGGTSFSKSSTAKVAYKSKVSCTSGHIFGDEVPSCPVCKCYQYDKRLFSSWVLLFLTEILWFNHGCDISPWYQKT